MTLQLTGNDLTRCSPRTTVIDKSKPKRLRIAIGVFDRIDDLNAALGGLSAHEIPETSIVLLCASEAREGDANPAGNPGRIGALAKSSAVFVRKGDRVERANSDPEPCGSPPLEEIVHMERWIEPRMAARLEDQLSAAACLLFGIAEAPEQELAICDVLIKHSVDQVQVHDFLFHAD